ncbi:superoxide dismutase family protein [Sphingomonadaceae bacterium jetA1]|uniref:superoxide dismutase family protein n=1 Tax=Facivitalis istanbulensis TaxID=3075838 RepID=UPI00346A5277
MNHITLLTLCTLTLGLTACDQTKMETGTPAPGGASATAMLKTGTGMDAGRATATEVKGGVRFTLDASNVPAGIHGVHIHMIGRCDAPDFTTAGGHWNPTHRQHGSLNPQGPHEGDMPNMTVGNDGRGTLGVVIPGATMAGLLDADGSAIVIHAQADDLKTDPSGNSGGRIACGVFQAN